MTQPYPDPDDGMAGKVCALLEKFSFAPRDEPIVGFVRLEEDGRGMGLGPGYGGFGGVLYASGAWTTIPHVAVYSDMPYDVVLKILRDEAWWATSSPASVGVLLLRKANLVTDDEIAAWRAWCKRAQAQRTREAALETLRHDADRLGMTVVEDVGR